MTTVMPTIGPESQGVQFTARAALRTRESISQRTSRARHSFSGGAGRKDVLAPKPSLSSIEVEALLRDNVKTNHDNIAQAFRNYDTDQTFSITAGELRRVLESFCFSLTASQFEAVLAKVQKNPNGTVKYNDFMDKFGGHSGQRQWMNSAQKYQQQKAAEVNTDMIEKMLRDKINTNIKAVVRGIQLYDYNMDGKIQKHELRKVLENCCFKFTDQQYDKLWQRYDFHHTGLVNYHEFLSKLGINVDRKGQPLPPGVPSSLMWKQNGVNHGAARGRIKERFEPGLVGCTFDQLEIEFRKRMKKNYVSLKKTFMTFDKHLDGFISLDDLKAILNQFTVPMTDQLFAQLMDRCGVRATGRIGWEGFLEKFQDPVTIGNGQTVPIRPNHKYFPIKETESPMKSDEIWKLLYKHANEHHASLKQAFLQYDKKRHGFVSRKQLREIVEKFNFRLSDDQFKELMNRVDPEHCNRIPYHSFLDLFEEKETPEGHKWLKSVHRYNDKPKSLILAWETVEDLLREKITENWKDVANMLMYYDSKEEGTISIKNLKKVLDKQVLPTSEEHFDAMIQKCENITESRVNYIEFLDKLNVDVIPGDINGLSSQIHHGSLQAEVKRLNEQQERLDQIDKKSMSRNCFMSADEVIVRLKDRIAQHDHQIRKAFNNFDKTGRGRVSKKSFRQVIGSFGMLLTDVHYEDLVSKLNFNKGFMNYSDFVSSFEDPRIVGTTQELIRTDNHRVNPIRGDEYGMSALEVESKLRSKLRENFADLRGAFYKFDDDHNGILTKENFRRLLDTFMFIMTDAEYEKLCVRMGINKKTKISYHDFLDGFEIRDTAEGHKWLDSVHRYNKTIPPRAMTAEEVHEVLKEKCHRQWKDLSKAFLTFDTDKNKLVTKKELREVLYKFVIPMTKEEFLRLWKMYDPEGNGYISHRVFLEKVGASEFTPADAVGTSTQIIDQSHKALDEHHEGQIRKHEEITFNQAHLGNKMMAEFVERKLRDKIRDNYDGFYKAFRNYDTKKRGWLTVQEIQKVLINNNFFLNDEEFFRLLDRIGLPTNKSKLNYEQFLHAFEDGRKSSYGRRKEDVHLEEYENLSPSDAEIKMKEKLLSNIDSIEKALVAFDKNQLGTIPVADFRRIISLFCFQMTDEQWKHYISKMNVSDDKTIDYLVFLEENNTFCQEDADNWLSNIQKTLQLHGPHLMQLNQIEDRFKELVPANHHKLMQTFSEMDYAKIGVVQREDFKEVINKVLMRITPEQFDDLWPRFPVNEFGNLMYKDFLRQYSDVPRPATSSNKRPQTSASFRSQSRLDSHRPRTMASRASYGGRAQTPLINAERAERHLKETIYRNWQDIQKLCRNVDKENTGTIRVDDFKNILTRYHTHLPEDEFENIITKFDIKENGTFSYGDFLRHFIINLKSQDSTPLLSRGKLSPNHSVHSGGDSSNSFYDAMLRVQRCVSQNWKEIRKYLRTFDTNNSGEVDPVDFKKALRQFNVNLSEEEFFHLLSQYDRNMKGLINYNDFIRAHID